MPEINITSIAGVQINNSEETQPRAETQQSAETTTEEPGFFRSLWNGFKEVMSYIPGLGFLSKTAENIADGVSEMCDGNFAQGAATAVGLGQEYNIATNERMGHYEKSVVAGKTFVTGLVSNAVSNMGTGSLGESAVNLGSDYAMAHMIVNARNSDEHANRDLLSKTLGGLSVKEWESLRSSLDTNNDGRVDQKEFNDAYAQLDKNNDNSVGSDDIAALGGRQSAIQFLMNNGSGRA